LDKGEVIMKISLPELLWYGNTTLDIEMPDDWEVEICPMRGAQRPPLTIEQMEAAIQNPIGSPTIKELAKGEKTAVILFDDMTRPTRTYEIAPIVLHELMTGGIAEEDITFVCALGTHGALTQNEFRKKLGADIIKRFRVFNHNIYENCVEVGTTSRGTRMLVNREVMEADLRVGIGCVTAHAQVGFSGGGKIILPGVAHVDSITHYHLDVEAMAKETTGLGNFDNNVLRFDIEEAARLANLDFKVDVVVNERGATTALFAGDFLEAHKEAVKLAKDVYATEPRPRDRDLIISNAFAKPNEMTIGIVLGAMALKNISGTLVIIANSPEGQVVHYLLGRFGRNYGGRQYPVGTVPPSINLIIMAHHLDRNFGDWVSNPEVITFTTNWDETIGLLRDTLGGGTRVSVLPNATMQYYAS
jgi:nickel-dependent lactate racemase